MNYKSIITNLKETSEKVQNWEKQGFVPSIEKDSVLETIRKIYDELTGGKYEQIKMFAPKENNNENCCNQVEANHLKIISEALENIKNSTTNEINRLQSTITLETENIKEFIKNNPPTLDTTPILELKDKLACSMTPIQEVKEQISPIIELKDKLTNPIDLTPVLNSIQEVKDKLANPIDLTPVQELTSSVLSAIQEVKDKLANPIDLTPVQELKEKLDLTSVLSAIQEVKDKLATPIDLTPVQELKEKLDLTSVLNSIQEVKDKLATPIDLTPVQELKEKLDLTSVLNAIQEVKDKLATPIDMTPVQELKSSIQELKEQISPVSEIKEKLANPVDMTPVQELKSSVLDSIKEMKEELASVKEFIGKANSKPEPVIAPAPVEVPTVTHVEEVKPVVVTNNEKKPEVVTPKIVSDIKVDVHPPVLGFYSFPEDLRKRIISELFDSDTTRAEIAVNKMCSFKTIDELLIYIEEHFSWNPESLTAMEFINLMSKKF